MTTRAYERISLSLRSSLFHQHSYLANINYQGINTGGVLFNKHQARKEQYSFLHLGTPGIKPQQLLTIFERQPNKGPLYSPYSKKMSSATNQKYYAFNLERYNSLLKTKSLGRPCVYLDVVDSTINSVSHLEENTIVLAKTQTNGVGQRDNGWQSPPGCAMASMKLICEQSSFLGERISFLQHFVALAIVQTLEQHNSQYLGKKYIRLKWPNDIYHVDDHGNMLKMGGVLIKTNSMKNKYVIIISFGLNVSNSEPTTCVNDILTKFNVETKVEIDELVAQVVNRLEDILTNVSEETFPDIKQDYMDRWIHTKQLVDDSNHGRVEIVGVDNDGYLLAKRFSDGAYCQLTTLKK